MHRVPGTVHTENIDSVGWSSSMSNDPRKRLRGRRAGNGGRDGMLLKAIHQWAVIWPRCSRTGVETHSYIWHLVGEVIGRKEAETSGARKTEPMDKVGPTCTTKEAIMDRIVEDGATDAVFRRPHYYMQLTYILYISGDTQTTTPS